VIKAQYTAAEAQVRIKESITGISEEMADVGMAMNRAEDKTEQMKAKSQALDEMLESGTLTDYTSSDAGSDEIERELQKASLNGSVEQELAKLKADNRRKRKNRQSSSDETEEQTESQNEEEIEVSSS
jgi:phage shock protein A